MTTEQFAAMRTNDGVGGEGVFAHILVRGLHAAQSLSNWCCLIQPHAVRNRTAVLPKHRNSHQSFTLVI